MDVHNVFRTVMVLALAAASSIALADVPDGLHGWCNPAGTKVDDKFSYLGTYDHAKGENAVHWFKVTRAFETREAVRVALNSEQTSQEEKAAIRAGTLEHKGAEAQAGLLLVLAANAAGYEGAFTCDEGKQFVLAIPVQAEKQTSN